MFRMGFFESVISYLSLPAAPCSSVWWCYGNNTFVLHAHHPHWLIIYLTFRSVLTNVLLFTSCGRIFIGLPTCEKFFWFTL